MKCYQFADFFLVYVFNYVPVVWKSWDLGVCIFYAEFKT